MNLLCVHGIDHVVAGRHGTDRSNCVEVRQVCTENRDDIDIVENVNTKFIGSGKEVREKSIFVGDKGGVDRLHKVHHTIGLKAMRMQPAHVGYEQTLDFTRRQAGLRRGR